ncbi:MAG TPA: glycerol-3-phosphate dehydrogenase/oxidase [Thermoanaerobaculia bacterium]|nr:glycerol-3-phosphate dehydrogenase/oxidase [Thermoanaerobaculia bacterium]
MRIAVIGGGINGAGIAWELARKGYEVVLFEQGEFGAQTSAATTKLIHGGLRYLEGLHLGLVREALRERGWLLEHIPQLVHKLEILLPVYAGGPRSRLEIRTGLLLYDLLAGRHNIGRHRRLTAEQILERAPLIADGLRGGFSYWDAQVDDARLVRTVVASAVADGVVAHEHTRVEGLERDGDGWRIRTAAGEERFELVVNAAGPWMNELLERNGIRTRYRLMLVRGSHLVLARRVSDAGVLLQSPDDGRVFFVLPWKETTLVGTTEVEQKEPLNDVHATEAEVDYLLTRFNRYFREPIARPDVAATFAGVRPLVGYGRNPGAVGREYRVTRSGNLINVFGGKMTTFMALARRVSLRVDNYFGHTRTAREPRFAIESAPP